MKESPEAMVNKQLIREHIPIPFMEGYELFIGGGEVNDEQGNEIQSVHIWKSGDEDGWKDLTGAGFFNVMQFVEHELRSRGIHEFAIGATDEKRQRVFEKWAMRKGCTVLELPDWDGTHVKVFTV
jgi:hypothetical protein